VDKRFRVAIIGAGQIAALHIKAIQSLSDVELAGVYDVDRARAEQAAQRGGARAYETLDAVWEDASVDGVHVCTPNHLHAEQAIRALEAGKHVLVEKPMALSLADCDRMIAAAQRAERVLMVGHLQRYMPVNRTARRLLRDGAVGEARHLVRQRLCDFTEASAWFRPWYSDKAQVGNCVLHGWGPHDLDILLWYIDSPGIRVYAQGTQSSELYRDQGDTYSVIVNHACGAVSSVTISNASRINLLEQVIIGTRGTLRIASGKVWLNGEEVPVEGAGTDALALEIAEFARCSREGGVPDADGLSSRRSMAVIEGALTSAQQNAPVDVGEPAPRR